MPKNKAWYLPFPNMVKLLKGGALSNVMKFGDVSKSGNVKASSKHMRSEKNCLRLGFGIAYD